MMIRITFTNPNGVDETKDVEVSNVELNNLLRQVPDKGFLHSVGGNTIISVEPFTPRDGGVGKPRAYGRTSAFIRR